MIGNASPQSSRCCTPWMTNYTNKSKRNCNKECLSGIVGRSLKYSGSLCSQYPLRKERDIQAPHWGLLNCTKGEMVTGSQKTSSLTMPLCPHLSPRFSHTSHLDSCDPDDCHMTAVPLTSMTHLHSPHVTL